MSIHCDVFWWCGGNKGRGEDQGMNRLCIGAKCTCCNVK